MKTKMFNSETIIHPKLHHLGFTTSNMDTMVNWYRIVLGMEVVHATSSAAPSGANMPPIQTTWMTNDEANHRVAFVQVPGLSIDKSRSTYSRVQHFAFEYNNLDDLLGTYVRLKNNNILPILCTDAGLQTAFYYADPNGNILEINMDNFGDVKTSTEYIKYSQEFAINPMGTFVDPDKLVIARENGMSQWEIHTRARNAEFLPDKPYDPRVMM